jgi:hypothetical protein
MFEAIKQIKDLFSTLPSASQIELLKQLSSGSGTATSISEFATKHSKTFGTNIEFSLSKSGADHLPEITATVHTAYGDFKGIGSNQKIAKAKAVALANESWS